jgi:hypothetical protein
LLKSPSPGTVHDETAHLQAVWRTAFGHWLVQTFTPLAAVEAQIEVLQGIIDGNPGTPLTDKIEGAHDKAQVAIEEMSKEPPDNQAAAGNIEGPSQRLK